MLCNKEKLLLKCKECGNVDSSLNVQETTEGMYDATVVVLDMEFKSINAKNSYEAQEKVCKMALEFLDYFESLDSVSVNDSHIKSPQEPLFPIPSQPLTLSPTDPLQQKKYSCILNEFIQKCKYNPMSYEFTRIQNQYECILSWESFTIHSTQKYVKKQEAKENVARQLYELLILDSTYSTGLSIIPLL